MDKHITAKLKQADRLLEASAEKAKEPFTKFYEKEADDCQKYADRWMYATAALAFLTLLLSAKFSGIVVDILGIRIFGLSSEANNNLISINAIPRITFLTVLIGATLWCGKNYKSYMHLYAVHRHRALSLQSLRAFRETALDDNAKDAVTVEAAKAAFGNVPTGFINSGDNSGSDHPIQMLNMNSSRPTN